MKKAAPFHFAALCGALCALSALVALPAHADEAIANRANLSQALKEFLAQRGGICVAKYDWPIDVSARDVAARSRDSIQLPVLERNGLVSSREGYVVYKTDDKPEESVPTKRYELTEQGRRFYKARETVSHPRGGGEVVHHADLCAGQLEMDAIVRITEPLVAAGQPRTASVNYLYRFEVEPWFDKADIRAVFPMIDGVIKGQGRAEMTQNFHFDGRRWVADTQLE